MAFITGTPGADSISGTGSSGGLPTIGFDLTQVSPGDGADTVIGNSLSGSALFVFDDFGNDFLQVGGWADTIGGGGANSVLMGGLGNDTLTAGLGRDELLAGGDGNDLLIGPGLGFSLLPGLSYGFFTALRGDQGNDTLLGGFGFNMYFEGGSGADSIQGSTNSDMIRGGSDGDTAAGNGGNDTLLGEQGDDSLTGGADTIGDQFDGGLGNDTMLGGAGRDTIADADGNDSIAAGANGDVINAGNGNNTVLGEADNDEIIAGSGNDSIDGGGGVDHIQAGDGSNTIQGGAGDDRLIGGNGNDSIIGGANDTTDSPLGEFIDAHRGNNTVLGGFGDDRIYASSGADSIEGQDGNDNIHASEGNNTLRGGIGNDNLFADFGADSIDGGDGDDFIDAGTGANTVLGGTGNDNVYSGGSADSLFGGIGNDSFNAAAGGDTVLGEDGNDFIDGGESNDRLDGGLGNDTMLAGGSGDTVLGSLGSDRLDGGDGTDNLDFSGLAGGFSVVITNLSNQQRAVKRDGSGAVVGVDTHANFENFIGSAGHDRITGFGTDENFTGGAGNDTIDGGGGFDAARYDVAGVGNVHANLQTGFVQDGLGGTDRLRKETATDSYIEQIITGAGADTLIGDSDSNWLRGGHGADSIDGGAGGDYADWSSDADANLDGFGVIANISGAAVVIAAWGTEGAVTVQGGTARDASAATDTLANIEHLRGTAFNDRLVGSADADNFYRAVQGADTIDGGFGYDWASHRSDNDANGDGFGVVVNLSGTNVAVASWGAEGAFTLAGGRARDGWSNIDVLNGVEGAHGSFQHDLLVGRDRKVAFVFNGLNIAGEDRSYLRGLLGADTLRGIEIDDAVQADYRDDIAGVVVRLDLGTAEDGWGFTDVLQNVQGASGSMMDDRLVAAATGSRLRGRAGNDTLEGNIGFDTAAFVTGATGVYAVLDNGGAGFAQDGEGGTDVLLDIEALTGAFLADTLVGNDEDNLFFGSRGADSMVGGLGEDVISYYTTWKTANASVVTGVFVNLTNNTARDGDGSSALGSLDRLSSIEHAIGSHLADTLTGNAGANSLMGGDGNDSLSGLAGNDVLEGGIGADTLSGSTDLDTASYTGSAVGVTINLALAGAQGGAGDGLGDLLVQVENLAGSAFADTLLGNGGNNGFAGNAGNDSIAAGAGDDTLAGGAGNDSLNGGAGLDVFRFNAPGEGRDGIFDFVKGTDLVHVVGAAFAALPAGALNAGRFALNAAADADDFFVFTVASRILSFDADGNGAGAAVQIAVFTINNLAAADIFVV